MKHVFARYVMILSLLLAIVGCSEDATSHQGQNQNPAENPDIDAGKNQPDVDTEEIDPDDANPTDLSPSDANEPDNAEPLDPEPALLEINELLTEYDSKNKRGEFIEFRVKSAGNLEGLKLYLRYLKTPFIYEFPAINVKKDEFITLHFRTLEENCVNELGKNLSASGGAYSCPTARDLWVPGNKEYLRKLDIAYLQDSDGNIMDAVVMNDAPAENWISSRVHFEDVMKLLFEKGAWKSADGQLPGPLDAVDTKGIVSSKTRSVSRYKGIEDTNTADDWFVTGNNGATPGVQNK